MFNIPDDSINRELASSERLLWSGAPARGLRFRTSDAYMIPFSLLWGGFAIFWEFGAVSATSASAAKAPLAWLFPVWGVPFVLIGLYMIVGRFFADAYLRARTLYAVTDQRVMILTNFRARETKSLSLRTLAEVSLREGPDGSGTITFGPSAAMMGGSFPANWPGAGRKSAPAFEFVQGARNVYDLIKQAQESAAQRR